MTFTDLFGVRVIPTSALPLAPSDKANARRAVRHGLASHYTDFEKWAGPVGPRPGDLAHVILIGANTAYVSKSFAAIMGAAPVVKP